MSRLTVWGSRLKITVSVERWGAYRLVRTVRHKLIVWKDPAKPTELYDLTADPAEEKNLYDKPEMQEVQKDLEARLRAWMERTKDPARQWPKVSGSGPSTQ